MAAADQECFVFVVLPGQTHFVSGGRFVLRRDRRDDALPDFWGRQVIERKAGLGAHNGHLA